MVVLWHTEVASYMLLGFNFNCESSLVLRVLWSLHNLRIIPHVRFVHCSMSFALAHPLLRRISRFIDNALYNYECITPNRSSFRS